MNYKKPNIFFYRLMQGLAWFIARFVFHRRFIRNEIKGKKGPFVIIANHQAKLDFTTLIGATGRPMSIVVSNSFYQSMPIKKILDYLGMIPKQQFQTTIGDMKRMKSVIDNGEILVLYPAGLMCENGLSTPIPAATYKFLKLLNADIYVARVTGTYFAMPKWANNLRPGKTYLDIYKLFSKEELASSNVDEIQKKADTALLFDAYREQEEQRIHYKNGGNIEGLENVLYQCPHCKTEFSTQIREKQSIFCTDCGYELYSDEYGFFHPSKEFGPDLRYVSDWSSLIYDTLKEQIKLNLDMTLESNTKIHMIDYNKHAFVEVGYGRVSLCRQHFLIDGQINGKAATLQFPIVNIPCLPFEPGKYLEIQHGQDIYRCILENGRLVMKYINIIKIFYELNQTNN
ncbi:MAG: 1-acyl-sn-glycerol-3-phosphate acyltransferase [Lachnospiraceae bacterium]|nr:1-acyl-sn-glycerol-3-phosphate acyltransferase [Lachnospiraceae bacterium]